MNRILYVVLTIVKDMGHTLYWVQVHSNHRAERNTLLLGHYVEFTTRKEAVTFAREVNMILWKSMNNFLASVSQGIEVREHLSMYGEGE